MQFKSAVQLSLLVVLSTLMLAIPLFGSRIAALATDFVSPGIGPHIANIDFVNYWFGGVFSLEGRTALLFDPPAYFARLVELFGPDYPLHAWSYPPHALLLFWPLGLMPYKLAMALFLAGTLALFLAFANALRIAIAPKAPAVLMFAALLPFVIVNLVAAQNGFLTGALVTGFLVLRAERPWAAGLCLALLTIKPQLGVIIPFMLLIDRQWRTIASAILFTAVLLAGSAILFGVDNWHAYVTVIMPFQREVMLDWEGVMLVMMPTVLTGLRLLGVEAQTALAWQIAFSLACLPVVVYALWKLRGPQYQGPAALVLTGGTILVTPYAFNYDMGALAAVAAILFARAVAANHGADNSRSLILAAACLVLYMLPLTLMLMGVAGFPLAPILIATCLLIYRRGEGVSPPHAAVFPGSTAR